MHEIGEHDGHEYIVTELADGGTLADWMAVDRTSAPGRSWREIVEVLTGVADGLAAAHDAQEILHRDIKPRNILISKAGYAKLADFGLAKLARGTESPGLTAAGIVVGTLAYMSPEQALGQPIDARSDIFSFGVVLYELLAGRLPFEGESDLKLVHAIGHLPPPALHVGLPESLTP